MTESMLLEMRKRAEAGTPVSDAVALGILEASSPDMPEIMACASQMKTRRFGRQLFMCSIINARSGACGEDCAFCAQSSSHKTHAQIYDLCGEEAIVAAYDEATGTPVSHFGVVTSGGALDRSRVEVICNAMKRRASTGVQWCASLGSLDTEAIRALKASGMVRFHHNIETAPSYFPSICSTHTIEERLTTLRKVKAEGLQVCSGGILGMGESLPQRVEMARVLNRENVDSIPLNFLVAIEGTRMAGTEAMKPLEILKAIAMFRMVNPQAEIKVCAGRGHLRSLQSMIFYAGATGMMVGKLLTTAGQDVAQDMQMLNDLEAME